MNTKPVYLNGDHRVTDEYFEVRDPGTGEICAQMSSVGRPEVAQAIADAQAAFPSWKGMTARDRGALLRDVADAVEDRLEEIALLITQENGKPLAQSKGEVRMTADHFRWFAEEGRRAYGRIIPNQAEGKRHLALRVPVGVVGAITPWNFPLVLAARKAAPALAAGCPVILRPASQTPLSSVALSECVHAVGLPAGVFQLVAGPARPIAAELLENPLCRKISFTGSTEVGKELIRGSAETVTNLSMELGGHAPVLVFEDADIEAAVEGAIVTKFRNTGQSCIAANRILVHASVYKEFAAAFCRKAGELPVGNGRTPGVEIGPLVNKDAFETAMRHIEQAVSDGAELLCGGTRADIPGGYFLTPTVLGKVPDNALCMREETFGPIAPIAVFESDEEAIAKANDTEYGLAAYAYTSNLSRAFRLAEELDAGTVGINDAVPSTSQAPFGGMKQSGIGRELGMEGLEAFLETKHISLGGITG